MKKRLLALLLCLVMVIGLVPFALADDPLIGGGDSTTQVTRQVVFSVNGDVPSDFNTKYSFDVKFDNTSSGPVSLAGYKDKEPNTTFPGYTFDGWYENSGVTGGGKAFETINVPYNATVPKGLYGTFTALKRNVLYKWADETPDDVKKMGMPIPPCDVDTGSAITLPTPCVPDGYVFDGWYYGSAKYEAGAQFIIPGVDEKTVVIEGRAHQEFTVTYKVGDEVVATENVVANTTPAAKACPADKVPADKTFDYWTDGTNLY